MNRSSRNPVLFCARCLYPTTHPLGLTLDDNGVCSGCRVHEEKDTLDWTERGQKLGRLLERFRSADGTTYDCVVPVSGARDSYFIVHTLKNVYRMNPLLVSYNRHYNTQRGHRNLAYLRTCFDCDWYGMVLAPDRVRRITERTLERCGSMYWHVLAGQSVLPVQVAVRYKIPLVVWGHHQGLDQVGMYSHLDEVEMTRKYRKNHDLMGIEAEDLASQAHGLKEEDLLPFFYPHDKDLESVGVRGIYLGNFMRWDSKAQHEGMIDLYGYEAAAQQRTFDTYNDVDCVHYNGLHDAVKFAKHGYGKVVDHACREIRLRRLDRAGAIELVRRYQNVTPADAQRFFDWIGISAGDFWTLIDRFRDPRVWTHSGKSWQLRSSVFDAPDAPEHAAARLGTVEPCEFRTTPSRQPERDGDDYALIARGYVDGHPAASAAGPDNNCSTQGRRA